MDQESAGTRLAGFAELDVSPIVEIHLDGRVRYANPAAQRLFPDLPRSGRRHPLIGNFEGILAELRRGRRDLPPQLRAEVRDDGPGIEPEPARRIFEKLYQVKSADGGNPSKGLGLGLFIAREIVTRQGGTLAFDSVPGKGSTFYFSLPLFELEPFLAPFFDPAAPENLHLLRVVVFPPGHALSGASARSVLLEARTILQHHLHAADRLLPETAAENAEGALFIASASPPAIAAMAARRLEELLATQHIVKVHWLQPKADAVAVDYDAKGKDALARATEAVWGVIKTSYA